MKIQKGMLVLSRWSEGDKNGLALVKRIFLNRSRNSFYVVLKRSDNSTIKVEYDTALTDYMPVVRTRKVATVRQAVEQYSIKIVDRLEKEVCRLFNEIHLQSQRHSKTMNQIRRTLKSLPV